MRKGDAYAVFFSDGVRLPLAIFLLRSSLQDKSRGTELLRWFLLGASSWCSMLKQKRGGGRVRIHQT